MDMKKDPLDEKGVFCYIQYKGTFHQKRGFLLLFIPWGVPFFVL